MAPIEEVRCLNNDKEFAWKFSSEYLRIGTRLVVNASQTAFLVKGGVIYDQFPPGNYTISTQNIPLLNKVLNIPIGSESDFQAEVWFVFLINKIDCKWGTITPMQIEDPKYGIVVPLRAFGQFTMKICRPKIFLQSLIDNRSYYSSDKIAEYFKGKIISSLTSLISKKMVLENISILEINAHLDSFSSFCQEKLDFKNYGIDILNFNFMAINVPEDDESIKRLKETKDLAARIKIMGKDAYQMDNQNLQASAPPPHPPGANYFVYVNEQQSGPYTMTELKNLAKEGKINRNSYVWKQGMSNWETIDNVSELKLIITMAPPPPPAK